MSTFLMYDMIIGGMQKFVQCNTFDTAIISFSSRTLYVFDYIIPSQCATLEISTWSWLYFDARNFRLGINLKLQVKEDECSLSLRTSRDHSSDIQRYIAATGTSEGKYKNTKLLCQIVLQRFKLNCQVIPPLSEDVGIKSLPT